MKNVKIILITLVVVAAFVALLLFLPQTFRNRAISLEEQISTAQAEISVQEKRRADLIPNLVDCVKAYDKHEYETLLAIVQARGASSDEAVNEVQTMIAAVAEAYPELKSNENYRELMNELATTENLIANYRSNYNSCVRNYNQYIRKFPNSFALGVSGYAIQEYKYLEFNVSHDAPTNLFDKQ